MKTFQQRVQVLPCQDQVPLYDVELPKQQKNLENCVYYESPQPTLPEVGWSTFLGDISRLQFLGLI